MNCCRIFLLAGLVVFSLTDHAGAVTPSTKLDADNNIEFSFDDGTQEKSSIKVAKIETAAAGGPCTATSEGAIRYNKAIKNVEFCNGSNWALLSNRPSSAALAGEFCSVGVTGADLRGVTRYNSNLEDVEFCDGTKWKAISQVKPVVDYTTCKPSLKDLSGATLKTYYQAFGASGSHNIHMACEPDYVVVAHDSAWDHEDTFVDAYCCKLKFE